MAKLTMEKFLYALHTRDRIRIETRNRRITSYLMDAVFTADRFLGSDLGRTVSPARQCYPQKPLSDWIGGMLSSGVLNKRRDIPISTLCRRTRGDVLWPARSADCIRIGYTACHLRISPSVFGKWIKLPVD